MLHHHDVVGQSGERLPGVLNTQDIAWLRRDHAVFMAYAPVKDPRYAVSVLVEHGGSGSKVAAPIARDVLLEAQTRRSAEWRPEGPPNIQAAGKDPVGVAPAVHTLEHHLPDRS